MRGTPKRRSWRGLLLHDEIESDGHVAEAEPGHPQAHFRAGSPRRDQVLWWRHEDRLRLCGLGDLDAASNDEVVADYHFGNGRPRFGPDDEIRADLHRADPVARRAVVAVIQVEAGQMIDVVAAFDERQNVRPIYS